MRYIPHTGQDVQQMLEAVGVEKLSDLFSSIADPLRLHRDLDLPEPLDEYRLQSLLTELAAKNSLSADRAAVFLGAGLYWHHVPAAVDQLLLRSEFFTSYTPYQAEVSQGTLQAIFEYQTMMAALLGCEVVNASMYDGASATAEALLMALRIKRKKPKVLLSRAVHPEVVQTCFTYLSEQDPAPQIIEFDQNGTTDLARLAERLDQSCAAVVIQQPNALGCLEPLQQIAELCHKSGALLIAVVLEPVSLGLLQSPGRLGADIVTGEGMGFGSGLNFGGPALGLFGASRKNGWQMPGRLVGQTKDANGRTGYVLTMSSREQHIRRARATSNICTNEGLCTLAAAIHMALLGKRGLMELATINACNARVVLDTFQAHQIKRAFPASFFNEFAVKVSGDLPKKLDQLCEQGILAGLALGRFYPELDDLLLVYVNELTQIHQVNQLAQGLSS